MQGGWCGEGVWLSSQDDSQQKGRGRKKKREDWDKDRQSERDSEGKV